VGTAVRHGLRHPRELDAGDINRFLAALAEREGLSASSQAQALSALLFLYRDVLEADLDGLESVARATSSRPGCRWCSTGRRCGASLAG